MKNADLAMYQVKNHQKNDYRFFSEEMNQHIHTMKAMESALRRALAEGEFELYYQPKFNLDTLQVCGLEALIRWPGEHSLNSPTSFIPFAEENGFIGAIGEYVIEQACLQIAEWQRSLGAVPKVAINISSQQVTSDKLVETFHRALAKYKIAASTLELEVTEYTLIQQLEEEGSVLRKLRQTGFEISVDDFGTGYSSLSYLKNLHIDRIKIDRSFIQEMISNEEALFIVESIVLLGQKLGIKVLAEGIETEKQLKMLQALGCDEGQGYFFSKPLPVSELTQQFLTVASKAS